MLELEQIEPDLYEEFVLRDKKSKKSTYKEEKKPEKDKSKPMTSKKNDFSSSKNKFIYDEKNFPSMNSQDSKVIGIRKGESKLKSSF